MTKERFALDKVIHERARLLILTYLASREEKQVPFTRLKEDLELTAGNLSIQLKNLDSAGYIEIRKRIREKKPETAVSLTAAGMAALSGYLEEMERIIRTVKGPDGD